MVSAICSKGRPATFRGMSISETGRGGKLSGTSMEEVDALTFLEEEQEQRPPARMDRRKSILTEERIRFIINVLLRVLQALSAILSSYYLSRPGVHR